MKNTAIFVTKKRELAIVVVVFATCGAIPTCAKMPGMDRDSSRLEAREINKQGGYDEVAKRAEEDLRSEQQAAITNECSLIVALKNLGEMRYWQERYGEAKELYQQALAIYEKQTSGCSISQQPYILNDLALVCKERGEYDEAETLLKRALDIVQTHRQQMLHAESYEVIHLNNLARVYGRQKKFVEAERIYQQLREILGKPPWKSSQAIEIVEENHANLLRAMKQSK
jgi:tetratricopeptide (TPR) repeat protein